MIGSWKRVRLAARAEPRYCTSMVVCVWVRFVLSVRVDSVPCRGRRVGLRDLAYFAYLGSLPPGPLIELTRATG
eukprot:2772325-Prymnesium_polylepis.2